MTSTSSTPTPARDAIYAPLPLEAAAARLMQLDAEMAALAATRTTMLLPSLVMVPLAPVAPASTTSTPESRAAALAALDSEMVALAALKLTLSSEYRKVLADSGDLAFAKVGNDTNAVANSNSSASTTDQALRSPAQHYDAAPRMPVGTVYSNASALVDDGSEHVDDGMSKKNRDSGKSAADVVRPSVADVVRKMMTSDCVCGDVCWR
jgi:hypothetical protein